VSVGKNLEGGGHGYCQDTLLAFVWGEWRKQCKRYNSMR